MLHTERLILRQWQDSDLPEFVKMNADPEVMRFFPATLSEQQSRALYQKVKQQIAKNGWGWWAIALQDSGEFIGATGLMPVGFESDFTPATEVGWRIVKKHWRKGYATEAASAALAYAQNTLKLARIVSFTATQNTPSIGVMEKLGMHRRLPDFDHPGVPDESVLKKHVLFEKHF